MAGYFGAGRKGEGAKVVGQVRDMDREDVGFFRISLWGSMLEGG